MRITFNNMRDAYRMLANGWCSPSNYFEYLEDSGDAEADRYDSPTPVSIEKIAGTVQLPWPAKSASVMMMRAGARLIQGFSLTLHHSSPTTALGTHERFLSEHRLKILERNNERYRAYVIITPDGQTENEHGGLQPDAFIEECPTSAIISMGQEGARALNFGEWEEFKRDSNFLLDLARMYLNSFYERATPNRKLNDLSLGFMLLPTSLYEETSDDD
ncbi:hypothetical protein D6817_01630 [Candidatus Pacearchaeota archaeon]|nr:MAG: hypothetical protein D6817_01630 [Candidatus Pacearchaeota archaeon]